MSKLSLIRDLVKKNPQLSNSDAEDIINIFCKNLENSINVFVAPKDFCTDNAAMIGAAALVRLKSGKSSSPIDLGVSARFRLDQSDLLYERKTPF